MNIAFGAILGLACDVTDFSLNDLISNNIIRCDSDVDNFGEFGGIAGKILSEYSNITDCTNYTSINGPQDFNNGVGGIAGRIDANSSVINKCYNKANISGNWGGTGGIVGELMCNNSKVYECSNTGEIGAAWGTGGILGWDASDNLEIYNCYNLGKIYNTYKDGGDFGGVIGQCRAMLTMYNCYNAGEIYSDVENCIYGDVGGIIGQNNEGVIYNCFNIGNINLCAVKDTNTSTNGIGGLIGAAGSDFGTFKILNCFNSCNLTLCYASEETVKHPIIYGEIIGSIYKDVTIENCYGYSNKTINIQGDPYNIAQNVGQVESYYDKFEGTKLINGYVDLTNSYPSVAVNVEQVTQNVQEVISFKSQKFCDILNTWSDKNSGYSRWIYDANKNNGVPYLECLKDIIK